MRKEKLKTDMIEEQKMTHFNREKVPEHLSLLLCPTGHSKNEGYGLNSMVVAFSKTSPFSLIKEKGEES